MRRSATRVICVLAGVLSCTLGGAIITPVSAQITFPELDFRDTLPFPQPLTSTAAAFDLRASRNHANLRVSPRAPSVPSDSIHRAITMRATRWLAQVDVPNPRPIALEDLAEVALAAGQDSIARARIAQRLTTPQLSAHDRGYALLRAVQAFADTAKPERIVSAEQYAAQLDQVPVDVAGSWQYLAYATIANAYDRIGQSDRAIEHGFRALQRVLQTPYIDRGVFYGDPSLLLTIANASASASANAPVIRARLDTIARALATAATPAAALVAADSAVQMTGAQWASSLRGTMTLVSFLGTPVPPLHATTWWNDAAAASQGTRPLNDGIVRVLLFGQHECCMQAAFALERMRQILPPHTDVAFVTATRGTWGSGLTVTPAQETAFLREAYLDGAKLSIPIALWAGEKRGTADGGSLPTPSPNVTAFHVPVGAFGTQNAPYLVVVDGRGIVRYIAAPRTPTLSRAEEARILAVVSKIRRES